VAQPLEDLEVSLARRHGDVLRLTADGPQEAEGFVERRRHAEDPAVRRDPDE